MSPDTEHYREAERAFSQDAIGDAGLTRLAKGVFAKEERRHLRTMHEAGAHETYNSQCLLCLDMRGADVLRNVYDMLYLLQGTGLRDKFIQGLLSRLEER